MNRTKGGITSKLRFQTMCKQQSTMLPNGPLNSLLAMNND
jgi:hypothetical protein